MKSDPFLARAADSEAMLPYWDLTDDLVAGADAMRLAGTKYLPQFPAETKDRYEFRLGLAKFTNIYRDIVENLAEKPFEEPISFDESKGAPPMPARLVELIDDFDGGGLDITGFAMGAFFRGINSAIDWMFVDYPEADPNVRTLADANAAGRRAFVSTVLARNVLEAKSRVKSGSEKLTYIRIFEPGAVDHVRIFRLRPDGIVEWAVFQKQVNAAKVGADALYWLEMVDKDDETRFVLQNEGLLSIKRIPLVPFWTGRRHGRTYEFSPPMRDAADTQKQLYRQESNLEFTKQMTAFPMLSANGIKPRMKAGTTIPENVDIGPNVVLWAPPDGAGNVGSWTYVEPSANSLKFLAEDVKETVQNLRQLGRNPLTAQSSGVTVITSAVAAGKAKSAVSAWGKNLEHALDQVLSIVAEFEGIKDKLPGCKVYNDYDEFDGETDLTALSAARTARDISRKSYLLELQRRRVLRAEFDIDEDAKELLTETPADDLGDDANNPDEKE